MRRVACGLTNPCALRACTGPSTSARWSLSRLASLAQGEGPSCCGPACTYVYGAPLVLARRFASEDNSKNTRRQSQSQSGGAAETTSSDFMSGKDDDPMHHVNRVAKEKLMLNDDERWLEAEIDENINQPEERYAHAKEVELIRNMMRKMREEHEEKLQSVKDERDKEIGALKKQMSQIEEKLQELKKE